MRHFESKLNQSNLVAGFERQDDADAALLALRIAGFPDERIGYYATEVGGRMEDQIAQTHRLVGMISAAVVGAILGVVVALLVDLFARPSLGVDLLPVAFTCAVIGALALGSLVGMTGLWADEHGTEAHARAGMDSPFVMSVDAGPGRNEAREIVSRCGGHEL